MESFTNTSLVFNSLNRQINSNSHEIPSLSKISGVNLDLSEKYINFKDGLNTNENELMGESFNQNSYLQNSSNLFHQTSLNDKVEAMTNSQAENKSPPLQLQNSNQNQNQNQTQNQSPNQTPNQNQIQQPQNQSQISNSITNVTQNQNQNLIAIQEDQKDDTQIHQILNKKLSLEDQGEMKQSTFSQKARNQGVKHKKAVRNHQQRQHNYKLEKTHKRDMLEWTKQEDELLDQLAEQHKNNWDLVALKMQTKSAIHCQRRWLMRKPKSKRKRWTPEEDSQLLTFVQLYQCNWSEISRHMKERTTKQIRERYINVLDPNINPNPWTEEEDKQLIQLFFQHGSKWCTISKFMNNRPENQIKNRFNSSLRKNLFNSDGSLKTNYKPYQTQGQNYLQVNPESYSQSGSLSSYTNSSYQSENESYLDEKQLSGQNDQVIERTDPIQDNGIQIMNQQQIQKLSQNNISEEKQQQKITLNDENLNKQHMLDPNQVQPESLIKDTNLQEINVPQIIISNFSEQSSLGEENIFQSYMSNSMHRSQSQDSKSMLIKDIYSLINDKTRDFIVNQLKQNNQSEIQQVIVAFQQLISNLQNHFNQ